MSLGLGERLCEARAPTKTLSILSPNAPRIDLESLDMIPFSESFSGLIDDDDNEPDDNSDDSDEESVQTKHQTTRNDMSYTVEHFPDVKDFDPEWDDDDIAEVMVLSPKQRHSMLLPTISEERDPSSPRSIQARCCETSPKERSSITLADFDIIVPPSGHPMLCRMRSTEKMYVIKALERWNIRGEQAVMEAVRALRAPFLERVHWSFPGVAHGEEGRMYIVLEPHSGSLLTLLKCHPIAPIDALFYLSEIVDGLTSLHNADIIHRDLTPSNIFIDYAGHVVLSNFANATLVARIGQSSSIPPSAAIEYTAPEILLGWTHDFAVDCWSLGILSHFVLTGKNPMLCPAEENLTVRSRILNSDVALDERLPREAKDLIAKCLERNPLLRVTIEGIRDHGYFANVDWHVVRQKQSSPLEDRPSPAPSLKLRPTSQDFPLPPTGSRLSYLDTSLDIPFTLQTASKAVPFQPRFERIPSREQLIRHPPFRSSSMDDLRGRSQPSRLSLNVPRITTQLQHKRSLSMRDPGTSSTTSLAGRTTSPSRCSPLPLCPSLQIQSSDSLPKIFRTSVLEESFPEEEEPSYLSPAMTSPTVCNVSPRERMAQFWETLDAEVDRDSGGSSLPSHEIRDALRLALPNPPLPGPAFRPRRLRKCVSSAVLSQSQSEARFSIISSASGGGGRKLRKLRRPLSTPFMAKRSEPMVELPSGLEQIGKGIGFTYKIPLASHSKASICTNTAPTFAGKLFRNGLGIGKSLLRKVQSQPRFSSTGGPSSHTRGPPAMIQTSHGLTSVAPAQSSPTSDGPLTPDSFSFLPLPEIAADPFAKDATGEEPRIGGSDATLRLVAVSSSEYRAPFSTTMQSLEFSSWNTRH